MEQKEFRPILADLTVLFYEKSTQQYETAAGSMAREAAMMNRVYFAVAGELLQEKIYIAQKPFWSGYSQLIAGDVIAEQETSQVKETLGSRFSEYVRMEEKPILPETDLPEKTLKDYWEALMNPIDFLIGEQEGLSVPDYQRLIEDVYGKKPTLDIFADQEKLAHFRQKAKGLSKKHIPWAVLAAKIPTKAFRFMGQRLVPDAEIFSKLPPPPPKPKGYVEPDLEFFNRLVYMVEKTYYTLDAAGLLDGAYRQKMAGYLAKITALREIVRKELANKIISDVEYELLT
jgi:hypothetical protein